MRRVANPQEILRVAYEVAITKLCSLYKIGPKFITSFSFDAVCYEDSI